MESYFSNKSFIKILAKWKYHLLGIAIIAIILSTFFSSSKFIKPKFKSVGVVYPINIYTYSEESETEQMLQMMNSSDIRQKLIKDFNLYKHYNIDPKTKYAQTYINAKLDDNVSFRKTEYESVEIRVLDTDPKIASDMADSLISYYDHKVAELHKAKYKEVVDIANSSMKEKSAQIDSLEKQIIDIRLKYGLIDFDIQAKELSKGQVKILTEGKANNPQGKEVLKLVDNLKEKGEELRAINNYLINNRKTYDSLQVVLDNAKAGYNKKITYAQVVSHPFPADKKSYPIRWIIVLFSTISAVLIAIFVIAFIESKRNN